MRLNREDIFRKAFHDCMKEMYAKSQPSVDYDQLLEDYKSGKIGKDERVYERHYLSWDEFLYIRDKYAEAYGMTKTWIPNIEVLEQYLNEGGTKDKYIPEQIDENGFKHPGYRGYEKVAPLKDQIREIMKVFDMSDCAQNVADEIYEKVMENIKNCKDFYRFDRERDDFDCNISLGASPTSNPKSVVEYWKSQGKDIVIEERNPLLFWEQDEYGEEFEEIMKDEYGDNWKEYWDQRWKREVEEREKEKVKRLEELYVKYGKPDS